MKNFTFLCLMLFASLTFAQNAPIDFEAGGNGAGWTWTVFENATNSTLEIVANPDPSGINTSATVAKFTALQAGNPWAGCESLHGSDLGPFVLDATTSTIKIKVWKSVISDVGIKLASPTGWSQGEIKVANTLVNQWEELTFNFSSFINPPASEGQLDQIIVFPDFNLGGRTQDNIIYFDDITFSDNGSAPTEPTVAAPTPTQDAANVISLFSGAYTNVTVDTWRTDWSSATLEDVTIAGNATKKYSALDFVGIETVTNQLDVSEMDFFHIDIWSPNFTLFGIKLVDFGANGAFGGGDDVEHQVNINAPAQATWVSLDIPLSDFTGLTTTSHIAQYILVGQPTGATTVYVDNVFFYKEDVVGPTEPTVAAPTPTQDAANVISLFSDAYTNVPVDTWRTDWSSATLEDVTIAGNATKKYSALDYVGIETVANQLDVSEMEFFHIDIWSPNFTLFGIKLVDFGADGAFGGGDDVEHQVNINSPAQATWVSLDIPLSDFAGLTTTAHIAQYILVGQPTGATTVYVDNVFFYKEDVVAPTEPTVAAPTPTQDAANVISLFSHVYTNVPVDTWRTDWSSATLEDVTIAGNPTKKYSALDFVGIETVTNQLDVSEMEFFHIDIWSPNFTLFGIKLVDFGADGAFGGGDDVEHQVNINSPAQATWVSLDIPLSDFVGLTTTSNIAQYILVGQPTGSTTVYVDNVFFYKEDVVGPTEPTVAAPTPTQDAANVISLFSDAYTNVPVDTWRTDWSSATLEDVTIAGNPTKKYSALDYVGIETVTNQLDVSEMDFFHIDIWSPNFTLFGIKLVDFGADGAFGGGDDVEHQVNINSPAQATWVSLDIPLSDFVGLTTTSHIAQYILVGQPTGATTVYVDNVFFYKKVVAENVSASAAVNVGSLIVQLSEYTSDANGDALTYNVSQPDQGGSLTFDATTGTVNIIVDNDFSGLMTIEYSVSDGTFTSTANIVVLIQNAVAVNLVRLNGKAQNNGNLIEWTTASEINNDYFTLYSSIDGTNYIQITTVKGVGNSNTNQHYQMLDKNAANGLTYYRLTQTDYDGTTKQLGVVTVSRNTTVFVSTIEPNPASNLVSLSFDSPKVATATLLVYDVVGKLVYTQQLNTTAGNNKLTLDVSSYAVGTYFVTINTPNGTSTTKLLKK
ncbi:MAG: T9SS type A sorting domain-containing protein [Sphingobacteriales bacterium]|nr:T9SS type A sorting domain-containing protein [Sphingobacteriales bacterium]